MTPLSMYRKAIRCVSNDIAGSFANVLEAMETMEPYEREPFLLMATELVRRKIQRVVDEAVTHIAKSYQLFEA